MFGKNFIEIEYEVLKAAHTYFRLMLKIFNNNIKNSFQ